MRFDAGDTIERAAVFKAKRRTRSPRQIDDFLETLPTSAARHKDAVERAFGAQRFDDGMNSDQNGQLPIIPRS
jgi:hypothetical protein